MVTITNLKLPASWVAPTFPNDNNFDIRKNKLGDFLQAFDPVDWGGINFINVGTINGQVPAPASGGIDLEETALLREEFFFTNIGQLFNELYDVQSGTVQKNGSPFLDHGVVDLVSGAVAGNSCELTTESGFLVDPGESVTGALIKTMQEFNVNTLAGTMAVACELTNSSSDSGPAINQGQFFANISDGWGFIYDPDTSANWQIWSMAGNVGLLTINTTTVAVTTTTFILQTILDQTAGTIQFIINGSMVGTISTNLPIQSDHFFYSAVFAKTASARTITIGAWEVQAKRVDIIP